MMLPIQGIVMMEKAVVMMLLEIVLGMYQ